MSLLLHQKKPTSRLSPTRSCGRTSSSSRPYRRRTTTCAPRPDPIAPAAHGLLQAVKDAGVSDDQLLDTALKAVDKLADAFEVRDGNIDDCF